jgi:hypothetical protein
VSLTRAQFRTQVAKQADIENSPRWDFTAGSTGEVDIKIAGALDRLWKRVLDANRFYRAAMRTPTSNSSGLFLLSDLNGGSADLQERYNRILKVTIDSTDYEDACDDGEKHISVWQLSQQNSGGVLTGRCVWWRFGNFIYTLPIQAAKRADVIAVNHLPTRFDQLSADSALVEWPEGYEDVAFNEAAADLLMKGAEESAASMELRSNGAARRAEMLETIARISTKPTTVRYNDDKSEWGG